MRRLTNFTESRPDDAAKIPPKPARSVPETDRELWAALRGCDRCREIPTVRNAMCNRRRINGYMLNMENRLSPVNSLCLGKFVGEGPERSIMFVGMSPPFDRKLGDCSLRTSDETAGPKLQDLLNHFGRNCDEFYLTNLVKCSTHDDKLPAAVIDKCLPWLLYEIDLKKPTAVVLLGGKVAEKFSRLLGVPLSAREEPYQVRLGGKPFTLFVIAHPGANVKEEVKIAQMAAVFAEEGKIRNTKQTQIPNHQNPKLGTLE